MKICLKRSDGTEKLQKKALHWLNMKWVCNIQSGELLPGMNIGHLSGSRKLRIMDMSLHLFRWPNVIVKVPESIRMRNRQVFTMHLLPAREMQRDNII